MNTTAFGPMRGGGGAGANELDGLLKQLSSATVKFSNDKLLKATGYLRDAAGLYKKGNQSRQEDFNRLFESFEAVKADKSSLPYVQHMEAIGALIPAFAVRLLPKEASARDHLGTCKESAQYYLNRILKAAKEEGGDANDVEWVAALNGLVDGLVKDVTGAGNSSPSTNTGAIAPAIGASVPAASKSLHIEENGFVVAERPLSSSPSAPSTGREEKNGIASTGPQSRSTSTDQIRKQPTAAAIPALSEFSAPELEGNRWYIRKASNKIDPPVVVTPEAINQALAIEDSQKLAVRVEGKINAIIADKCCSLDMEIDDVVSNVELLACNKVRLFLKGHVPTMVLDECEAVQVYISSASSKDIKILTSKCAEVNVLVQAGLFDGSLQGDEAMEYREMALPEQFVTSLNPDTGKLVTEAASHIGA